MSAHIHGPADWHAAIERRRKRYGTRPHNGAPARILSIANHLRRKEAREAELVREYMSGTAWRRHTPHQTLDELLGPPRRLPGGAA